MKFVFQKLNVLKVLDSPNVTDNITVLRCSQQNYKCMYGLCMECSKNVIILPNNIDGTTKTFYWGWINRKETRSGKGNKEIKVNIVVKDQIRCQIYELIAEANKQLGGFCKHLYNIHHQNTSFKDLKSKLQSDEIALVIDFSENYSGKYSSEIQSVHFGASRPQISLHTGCLYHPGESGERAKIHAKTFCTISDSTEHSAYSIWAHLLPILSLIEEKFPDVVTLHFRSDGPVTQYRNKFNFFLLSRILADKKFQRVSWTFSEAGHGKSAADGVGGVVKRVADQYVANGNDILSCKDLLEASKNLKTLLVEITDNDINEIKNLVKKIDPIPQTLSIHQIVWNKTNPFIFGLRLLACDICDIEEYNCTHFSLDKSMWKIPNSELNDENIYTTSDAKDNINASSDKFPNENEREFETEGGLETGGIEVGSFVAVAYSDNWYPGKVCSIDKNVLNISFMVSKGNNRFCWPGKLDTDKIEMENILCKLEEPLPLTSRLFYLKEYERVCDLLKD